MHPTRHHALAALLALMLPIAGPALSEAAATSGSPATGAARGADGTRPTEAAATASATPPDAAPEAATSSGETRVAAATAPASAPAPGELARATVESLHDVLLACMQEADELGFKGRYERIHANLDETFDLPFMARTSIGSAWKQLSDEQRRDFVTQQHRLSAANYADNFSGFGGERFETLGDEPAARGTIVVKTRLVQPEDPDVEFDYRLRKVGERWEIIDVQLDGKVSEITLRRADYRSVIQREGFDELVKAIDERIATLASQQ